MKRRSFLQALAGLPLVPFAPHAMAESAVPPFMKEGALRLSVNADLSEVSLEDAIVTIAQARTAAGVLVQTPSKYALVVHPQSEIYAAKLLVDEINRLRVEFPLNVPAFEELRVDRSFTDIFEWGLVADDGRCLWSPGA